MHEALLQAIDRCLADGALRIARGQLPGWSEKTIAHVLRESLTAKLPAAYGGYEVRWEQRVVEKGPVDLLLVPLGKAPNRESSILVELKPVSPHSITENAKGIEGDLRKMRGAPAAFVVGIIVAFERLPAGAKQRVGGSVEQALVQLERSVGVAPIHVGTPHRFEEPELAGNLQMVVWRADPTPASLVLASASARRADMLRKLGLEFRQRPVELEEAVPPGMRPADAAVRLAQEKAEAAAADVTEGWVLGADTIVWHKGRRIDKPASAEEALHALLELQGDTHEVFTGLCVLRQPGARVLTHVERTEVRFAPLDRATLEAYVATGEPMGKAGGYAIQGIAAAYIEDVRGSVDNVVGLPVRATVALLARSGYPLPPHLRMRS